ncbi:sigma-70 family RNA polymerase sigma factor [Chitinophaga agrisoli]|uniref:Sigma-70 family RNA polymerase sigma factor n=1 Tax=Chitinophaga agrisoli TaxID=2607653 RepID=A0A5B2VVD3_9BACT|nr:sigma-70 family RNA polymerase sigma factor [Chitinophaga agrisoli]KAA2242630.1 sigma-70 family RNA polymerase sigma factor [Chitinophaga agrisoli]
MHINDQEDQHLVNQVCEGVLPALQQLIQRYQHFVFDLALSRSGNPQQAYEWARQVFVKMIAVIATYDRQLTFRTWLQVLALQHFDQLPPQDATEAAATAPIHIDIANDLFRCLRFDPLIQQFHHFN